MQKSVSPKRGVGTKEKDDRPRLRNASSHDYQKTVVVETEKKQKTKGPGPAFAGPVCIKLTNFDIKTNK